MGLKPTERADVMNKGECRAKGQPANYGFSNVENFTSICYIGVSLKSVDSFGFYNDRLKGATMVSEERKLEEKRKEKRYKN